MSNGQLKRAEQSRVVGWLRTAVRGVLLAVLCVALAPLAAGQDSAPAGAPKGPAVVPAHRRADHVVVITMKGEIDSEGVMTRSVERRIAMAERAGASAIVFELDTPGGDVGAVLEICQAIKSSKITNTVAWVNRNAYSGGAIVALACREIVVNDPAAIGDAKPISGGPLGLLPQALPREMLRKLLPPLVSEVTGSVRRHNEAMGRYDWDEYLAKAMVVDDMQLWAVRHKVTHELVCIDPEEFRTLFPGAALGGPSRLATLSQAEAASAAAGEVTSGEAGVPNGSPTLRDVAAELAAQPGEQSRSRRPAIRAEDAAQWELLGKVIDGTGPALLRADDAVYYGLAANPFEVYEARQRLRAVSSDDDLKAFFLAKKLTRYDQSWSEGLVLVMTHIAVRFVLVVAFLIAMFVELTHPGAAVPGLVAVVALVGLVAPSLLIGLSSWWAVVAILAGVLLLAVEVVFVPGFGVPGVMGLILLFLGLVGVFLPGVGGLMPGTASGRTDLLYYALMVLMAMTTAVFGLWTVLRHLGAVPVLNRLVLRSTPDSDDASSLLGAMGDDEVLPAEVGDRGVALTTMRPAGRVDLKGKVIDAVAEFGYIEAGRAVRVTSVDGVRIGVEEEPQK